MANKINIRQLSTISIVILGNFETTMIQKQSKVILVNYKENYDTTTTTIQWVLTSVQFNLVCFLSQTGSWEILVRVAIPTRTVCARGYSHAHNTLVLVHISVRVA